MRNGLLFFSSRESLYTSQFDRLTVFFPHEIKFTAFPRPMRRVRPHKAACLRLIYPWTYLVIYRSFSTSAKGASRRAWDVVGASSLTRSCRSQPSACASNCRAWMRRPLTLQEHWPCVCSELVAEVVAVEGSRATSRAVATAVQKEAQSAPWPDQLLRAALFIEKCE